MSNPQCGFCFATVVSGITDGVSGEIVDFDEYCIPCQDSSDDPDDPIMKEWANMSPVAA